MKRSYRPIVAVHLIFLFSFLAGIGNGHSLQWSRISVSGPNGYSFQPSSQFCPPFRAEHVFSGFGTVSQVILKTLPDDLLVYYHPQEAFLARRVSDYISFSKILFNGLASTDIIFPFHHFW